MIDAQALVTILVQLIIWGLIIYVLFWAIGKVGLPEPFQKISMVVLVILTVIILLNILSGFLGAPLFHWGK